jgi:hypothetical protein
VIAEILIKRVSELEFVGFMRKSINDLTLMGLTDIDIPAFLRKVA